MRLLTSQFWTTAINRGLGRLVSAFARAHPWAATDGYVPALSLEQLAAIGSGFVPTFERLGERYVVLAQVGPHATRERGLDPDTPYYTILGGFINLSRTEGSEFVPASDEPEQPAQGAAREGEEELKNANGTLVMAIDPARLKIVSNKTINTGFQRRCVALGHILELTRNEALRMMSHVAKLQSDEIFRKMASLRTKNKFSGLPEVETIRIFKLDDVLAGDFGPEGGRLLNLDQIKLFQHIKEYYVDRTDLSRLADHMEDVPALMI